MHKTLQFESADFSYTDSSSKLQPKNTRIRHFLVSNLKILVLHDFSHIDKFKGVDFKIDKSVFKFQSKHPNKPCKAFLVLNLMNFIFAQIFFILMNSRVLISNFTIAFQNYSPKIPK